ncbi:hypothetical protein UFOVP181_362 [uncultured Caudovirales phage]|uniref:Uncharacterized protein n=1 Tax=uncultured Caudovirales phage TaxID=2100421 RepID=A0A6J7WJ93_9CAUD|nr:hypothetical protein UFOVP57_277 [uncultured Caudovirales phage]CAB5209218.1 hypothetical protein UFOVP181_362 [uncultured Caudovirales phage]
MARYNTIVTTASSSGATTVGAPTQGLITTLTGTAPYTVTLAAPNLFAGVSQLFYNATGGTVTLTTPSGSIKGPGFTAAASQTIPDKATYTLSSDGTDFIITNNEGGPQLTSTITATGLITANAGLTVASSNASFTGTLIQTSSTQTISSAYDLVHLNYLQTNYGQAWTIQSASFSATQGGRYFIDTSSTAITMTLPASPATGSMVHIIDYSGTLSVRNLTIAPNGAKIQRIADNMTVSTNGAAFVLLYSGSTNGWLVATGI